MGQFIYTRVSTDRQLTENQLHDLKKTYPEADIFEEVASGVKSRPVLNQLVQRMKRGDELIIFSLDRLGRNTSEILALLEALYKTGVRVVSKREGLDYSTPVGRLVSQVLVSVAELERSLFSERTKVALAALKASGKKLGRKKEITDEQIEIAKSLLASGLSLRKVAKEIGFSHARLLQIIGVTGRPRGRQLKPKATKHTI